MKDRAGAVLCLIFIFSLFVNFVSAKELDRNSIAFALAQQLLRGTEGYNHYAHVGRMKQKATTLNKRAQEALINFANEPGPHKDMLLQRVEDDSAYETRLAVDMIRKAHQTANGLQGEDLERVIESVLNTFQGSASLGENGEGLVIHHDDLKAIMSGSLASVTESMALNAEDELDKAIASYATDRLKAIDELAAQLDQQAARATEVYDAYADQRKSLRDWAVATVMTNMLARSDKNGVLTIQFESRNFTYESVAGYDAWASFETDPQGYVNAINALYSPITGVKVGGVGTYRYETYSNEDLLVTSHTKYQKGGGVMIYVVADLDAERKVTLLAAAAAREMENATSLFRQESIANVMNEVRALKGLAQELRSMNPTEYSDHMRKSGGALSVVEVQVNPKGRLPENFIPGESNEAVTVLSSALQGLIQQREKLAEQPQSVEQMATINESIANTAALLAKYK